MLSLSDDGARPCFPLLLLLQASFVASCSVALPQGGGIMVMVDQLSRLTQHRLISPASPGASDAGFDPFTGTSYLLNFITKAIT
jgi:hypothetical protein